MLCAEGSFKLRLACLAIDWCGHACTLLNRGVVGVSFSTPNMAQPYVIDKWPGTDKVVYKVPTTVCYRAGDKRYRWGFQCVDPELAKCGNGRSVISCFKLHLDPKFLRETYNGDPEYDIYTEENVRMWWTDFLRGLHDHVVKYISTKLKLGDWKSTKVEYNFSIPTTWYGTDVIETFKGIVVDAGFKKTECHALRIDMTEAEAAAVYTGKSSQHQHLVHTSSSNMEPSSRPTAKGSGLEKGHTLLICDSGGGTTVGFFCCFRGQLITLFRISAFLKLLTPSI